jgi:hypothetical protein
MSAATAFKFNIKGMRGRSSSENAQIPIGVYSTEPTWPVDARRPDRPILHHCGHSNFCNSRSGQPASFLGMLTLPLRFRPRVCTLLFFPIEIIAAKIVPFSNKFEWPLFLGGLQAKVQFCIYLQKASGCQPSTLNKLRQILQAQPWGYCQA